MKVTLISVKRNHLFTALVVALVGAMSATAFEPKRESDTKKEQKSSEKEKKGSDDKKSEEKKSDSKKSSKTKGRFLAGFTKEREAAALTFVRSHHPELADLLAQLKAANVTEYQRAIRDLFLSSEHLAQIEERNPQRYDLELQNWRVNSRIQLLVARMTMQPSPALESELRQVLAERIEVREQLLEFEHERAQSRLAETNARLEEFRKDRSTLVDTWLEELLEQARSTASVEKQTPKGG
jgi:hypothetical protein